MYIEKLHIDSFGKISGLDLDFSDGINIIEGPNESGKSTIAAFIKFILYGIPSKERKNILSWESGRASGSLTLMSDDKSQRFRIERSLAGSKESLQFIDGNTNLPIRNIDTSVPIGELLFGVDADMFSATAFVSQIGDSPAGGAAVGGSKVSEGIENILFSADESVNAQKAAGKLDSARAALLHKNGKGGLLFETEEKCAALELRLSNAASANMEITELEAQLADSKEKLADSAEKAKASAEKADGCEAWVLLRLFEKADGIRERMRMLGSKLSADDSADAAAKDALERQIATLNLLREEMESAEAKEVSSAVTHDPRLEEYMDRGGRRGLESEQEILRTHKKTFTVLGILCLVIGLILALMGLFPILLHSVPNAVMLGLCAFMLAGGVSLLIAASKKSAAIRKISDEFDFDELDGLILKEKSEKDAIEFANLAAESAKKRFLDAVERAELIYGCPVEKLGEKLTEITKKQSDISLVRIEYDKQKTLLSQIEEQIRPYSEAELREKAANIPSDVSAAEDLQTFRREAKFFEKQADVLEKRTAELEKTLAGLYPTAENPSELSDKLAELRSEAAELAKKHAAYKLAFDKLNIASDSLRAEVAPKLARDAAKLMAHITGGKYTELGVESTLDMSVTTEAGLKPISVLSAGTKDAAYICLRLALISLLYRSSTPPVIFDEAFSRQDDSRLGSIMQLIKIGSAQSIIFTSNSREATAAEKIGDFKHIRL